MAKYEQLFDQLSLPYVEFQESLLGAEFADELAAASRVWFEVGYAPGVAAYLNFFLLHDMIVLHDQASPPRFLSFKSMAESFYRTDLFIRDVTDSGREPTGGISNPAVRKQLKGIMARHERLEIPQWMMSYFGYQLLECVEQQAGATFGERERQLHLNYMTKAFLIMGVPFSNDSSLMKEFCRDVETNHAGSSPHLKKHARHILRLAIMVGVPPDKAHILKLLPETTRAVYEPIHEAVRPSFLRRVICQVLGKFLMPKAIGEPRLAVPHKNEEL